MSKRMTKREFQESLGVLNPVGHVVLAFANDAIAGDARADLLQGASLSRTSSATPLPSCSPILRK